MKLLISALFVRIVWVLKVTRMMEIVSSLVPSVVRIRLMRYFRSTDLTGYETLVDFMRSRKLMLLEGHIVDIGAFLGGGAAKLARFCRAYGKKVYAIDIFDPDSDTAMLATGIPQSAYYKNVIASFGKSQREIYNESIKGLDNIVTIDSDSMLVALPHGEKIVFGFVDGNHQREHVLNDFYLVWNHLVPGGAVALDDYKNPGVPHLTATIDELRYHQKVCK